MKEKGKGVGYDWCNVKSFEFFLKFHLIGIYLKEYGKFAPFLKKSKIQASPMFQFL
jgi:hypothetical protein